MDKFNGFNRSNFDDPTVQELLSIKNGMIAALRRSDVRGSTHSSRWTQVLLDFLREAGIQRGFDPRERYEGFPLVWLDSRRSKILAVKKPWYAVSQKRLLDQCVTLARAQALLKMLMFSDYAILPETMRQKLHELARIIQNQILANDQTDATYLLLAFPGNPRGFEAHLGAEHVQAWIVRPGVVLHADPDNLDMTNCSCPPS